MVASLWPYGAAVELEADNLDQSPLHVQCWSRLVLSPTEPRCRWLYNGVPHSQQREGEWPYKI